MSSAASSLSFYNSLTRRKEPFVPLNPGKVSMYVCGVTVYDRPHVGHARAVVVFDVLFRYLQAIGQEVHYVRNFTDVDDKIIKRANERGISCSELTTEMIAAFHEDMDALGAQRPTSEPRVTTSMEEIRQLVQKLIDRGHAYQVDGDVYFDAASFDGYGMLSGRKLDDQQCGFRIDVDSRKRNPQDFALWKSVKPGEPSWDSPWGPGRPGWHIECSAMSMAAFGERFDIHGGGRDLLFPHHENEIAQSDAACGHQVVGTWLHNGMITIDSEKMSKSLGNFFTLRDVLCHYHPETLRMFFLNTHYRSPLDYSDKALDEAQRQLERLYAARQGLVAAADGATGAADAASYGGAWRGLFEKHRRLWGQVSKALDDDLNSAAALGKVYDLIRTANKLAAGTDFTAEQRALFGDIAATFDRVGAVLGLLTRDEETFLAEVAQRKLARSGLCGDQIQDYINQRNAARDARDWAEADRIRKLLAEKGVELRDGAEGTTWRVR